MTKKVTVYSHNFPVKGIKSLKFGEDALKREESLISAMGGSFLEDPVEVAIAFDNDSKYNLFGHVYANTHDDLFLMPAFEPEGKVCVEDILLFRERMHKIFLDYWAEDKEKGLENFSKEYLMTGFHDHHSPLFNYNVHPGLFVSKERIARKVFLSATYLEQKLMLRKMYENMIKEKRIEARDIESESPFFKGIGE